VSEKEKKPRFKRKERYRSLTRHHILPRSLGGSDDDGNIIIKSVKDHQAWHQLFGLSTPKEAIEIIRKYWTKNGKIEERRS